MMTQTSMQRYLVLINVLLFPHRGLKWMMILGVALILVGFLMHFIWPKLLLCAFFGGAFIVVNIGMQCIEMPSQMLSLNSSKQFGLLPGLRKKTYIICFVFILLSSIAFTLLMPLLNEFLALKNSESWLQIFLAIFSLLSIFVIGGLFIVLRWSWADTFMSIASTFLIIEFALLTTMFLWLVNIHITVLLVGLIIGWVVFLHSWLNWRSVKLHRSLLGMSYGGTKKNHQELQLLLFQNLFKFLKSKPQTLIGTLLFGVADGWQVRVKSVMSGITLVLVFLGFDWAFLGSRFVGALSRQTHTMLFIIAIALSFTFYRFIFRNVYKLWMLYPQSRYLFFFYLEKSFYSWVLVVVAPTAALLLTSSIFVGGMKNIFLFLPLIFFAVALLAFNFYITMLFYCKISDNDNLVKWIRMGYIAGLLIVFIIVDNEIQLFPLMLVLTGGLFGGAILMRNWAKKCWLWVDFSRVKN